MSEGSLFEQLNAVKYVFLRELSEPRDNSLRIVVEEAVANRLGTVQLSSPELTDLVKDGCPIESLPGCKTFEIYWKRYAAYLVTEELVGSNATGDYEDEVFSGEILRFYTKSHFLDHVGRDTGGHIKAILHYKLICLNHLIDIAVYAEPEIRVLSSTSDDAVNTPPIQ
jgi:hypothetical protein